MREICTSGSVGRAPGNRCLYPEADTGERGSSVVGAAPCCSPVRLRPGVDTTSDVKGWEPLFYVRSRVFFLLSLGRVGARKTRRLSTRLSVGWLPPSWPPSGAGRMRGTSGPVGLRTPPRVPPHRGGVSADGREHRGTLGLPPAAVLMPVVAQPWAGPWPTSRHAMLGPWRPRPDGPCCPWPSGGATVCRVGPGPAHGGPGARWGALPGGVGDAA